MSKDFFKRKEPKALELPDHEEYDLSNSDNDLESCGIEDTSGFKSRFDQMLDKIGDSLNRATKEIKSNPDAHVDNLVGITCQVVEKTLDNWKEIIKVIKDFNKKRAVFSYV